MDAELMNAELSTMKAEWAKQYRAHLDKYVFGPLRRWEAAPRIIRFLYLRPSEVDLKACRHSLDIIKDW